MGHAHLGRAASQAVTCSIRQISGQWPSDRLAPTNVDHSLAKGMLVQLVGRLSGVGCENCKPLNFCATLVLSKVLVCATAWMRPCLGNSTNSQNLTSAVGPAQKKERDSQAYLGCFAQVTLKMPHLLACDSVAHGVLFTVRHVGSPRSLL